MAFSRYSRSPILNLGSQYGTATGVVIIRNAIKNGSLSYQELIINESQRLDHIAGSVYGDGKYWWVLAAASSIGWGLQIPPGTVIYIPDLDAVASLIG